MSKELEEGLTELLTSLNNYRKTEPHPLLVKFIDQYAYEYAERVVGSAEPINPDWRPNSYVSWEATAVNTKLAEQHKRNQELSPHRATKEGEGEV